MDSVAESSLIHVQIDHEGVAIIKINRPEKRNALSQMVIDALVAALKAASESPQVKVIVLTGSRLEGPFSAGADLSELQHLSTADAFRTSYLQDISKAVAALRKPIIACVAGFALGGGFELAMMCDMIFSTNEAKFGLPELKVGTIPGAGGTQRLARLLGKQKAMEMILTSLSLNGSELQRYGLIAQTCQSAEDLLPMTMVAAHKIASLSVPVVMLAKAAILNAEQTHLDAGLKYEQALYYSSFALEDRTEGMKAFVEKRKPVFKDE